MAMENTPGRWFIDYFPIETSIFQGTTATIQAQPLALSVHPRRLGLLSVTRTKWGRTSWMIPYFSILLWEIGHATPQTIPDYFILHTNAYCSILFYILFHILFHMYCSIYMYCSILCRHVGFSAPTHVLQLRGILAPHCPPVAPHPHGESSNIRAFQWVTSPSYAR